jgi:uncharacterized protein (TIGR02001 family)
MKLTHGLAALALALAATAAQAELTGTITGVSDYDFRGITQTGHDPALQGSIDYAHDSGFYVGAWASSSLDFGNCCDENYEIDYYGGFRGGDAVTFDVGAIYYSYPGTSVNVDYPEIYGGLGWQWLSGKVWYSPDFGSTGDTAWYYEVNGNWSLPANFGLSAHIGYSDGDYWDSAYNGSYSDWAVGVTYALGHFTLGLKWIDGSDLEDLDDFCPGTSCGNINKDAFSTDARAVFSVSTTFPWKNEE